MRNPRLFKDQSKLSFDYVPDKLCHREEQLERLEMLFRPVLDGSMSQTAFLIGSVGTGKTATSKRFCLDLMKAAQEKGDFAEPLIFAILVSWIGIAVSTLWSGLFGQAWTSFLPPDLKEKMGDAFATNTGAPSSAAAMIAGTAKTASP